MQCRSAGHGQWSPGHGSGTAGLSPADFSLSLNQPRHHQCRPAATYTLTLTRPRIQSDGHVKLQWFPTASTCLITPPAVTLDGANTATATVTVQTTARGGMLTQLPCESLRFGGSQWRLWSGLRPAALLAPVFGVAGRLSRASRQCLPCCVLGLLAVSVGSNSCGSNSITPWHRVL